MTSFARLAAAALALAGAGALVEARAHGFEFHDIAIDHPYARATGPGMATGGAYLTLANHGRPDRLLAARAAVSASVELHEMKMVGDVMRMRSVDAVDLPVGQPVVLGPGGLHVMLVGLKAPLRQGTSFPLTLTFEHAGETVVTVNVEGAGADHAAGHVGAK